MSFKTSVSFQIFLSAFKVCVSTRKDMLKSKIQFKGKRDKQQLTSEQLNLVNHVIMHSCRGSVTECPKSDAPDSLLCSL